MNNYFYQIFTKVIKQKREDIKYVLVGVFLSQRKQKRVSQESLGHFPVKTNESVAINFYAVSRSFDACSVPGFEAAAARALSRTTLR